MQLPADSQWPPHVKVQDAITSDSDSEHLRKLLAIHTRNRQILEQQIALHSDFAPLHLLNQLEGERKAVAEIEDRLQRAADRS